LKPLAPTRRVWTLRSHLSWLLMVCMVLTFALVGGAVLAWRMPRIENETRHALQHEVAAMAARVELLLGARQAHLVLLDDLLHVTPPDQATALLNHGVGEGNGLRALYWASDAGELWAVGLPYAQRGRRHDVLASALRESPLFQAAMVQPGVVWRGHYASVLTGDTTVGVALRSGHARGGVLIAEVPLHELLVTIAVAAGGRSSSIWVVDQAGERIADTSPGRELPGFDAGDAPLPGLLVNGGDGAQTVQLQGGAFHVATVQSTMLGWAFVGNAPMGLANPQVRRLVLAVAISFAGCVVIGLLVTPAWAVYLSRPLQTIVERAAQTLRGGPQEVAWPRLPVTEFNQLARHLATMAMAMRERELTFKAIFNASPVSMAVLALHDGQRLVDVNDAWCQQMQYGREHALGLTVAELDPFNAEQRDGLVRRMTGDAISGDVQLRRRDGELLQVRAYARQVALGKEAWRIWANIDTGPMRRIEQQLRELNHELEDRVRQRTEALEALNGELSTTVAQLRAAQTELVRAEKMAALGALVTGVAQELHTPLGNSVMAVSAIADATGTFKKAMQHGVRRADLNLLVETMEQGADIAQRNLLQAAELVQSFKQVAVDQTSSQRRSFELADVVREMVTSLRPSLARTPYRIEVDVPATGLRMDSYPGALGQAIGNLVDNAVRHGFAGRAHGTVRLDAGRTPDGHIVLRVCDDGRGIAPALIDRIFEPFLTRREGRGGAGLGLHIAYNAVANLLGGTLSAASTEGEGACFELHIPAEAPPRKPSGFGFLDTRQDSAWTA
jgi:PAS domain S-box-containing protein